MKLALFLVILLSSALAAASTGPLLKIGSVYTYAVCDDGWDNESGCNYRDLTITLIRTESTLEKPELSYVFYNGKSEVKISVEMWDGQLAKMVRFASNKNQCEDSGLSNAFYNANHKVTVAGKKYAYCSTGCDSEYQSSQITMIGLLSPLPFRGHGEGNWSENPVHFSEQSLEARESFRIVPEYLQLLGLDAGPGSSFRMEFEITKIFIP